jgi:hypothetical protein
VTESCPDNIFSTASVKGIFLCTDATVVSFSWSTGLVDTSISHCQLEVDPSMYQILASLAAWRAFQTSALQRLRIEGWALRAVSESSDRYPILEGATFSRGAKSTGPATPLLRSLSNSGRLTTFWLGAMVAFYRFRHCLCRPISSMGCRENEMSSNLCDILHLQIPILSRCSRLQLQNRKKVFEPWWPGWSQNSNHVNSRRRTLLLTP